MRILNVRFVVILDTLLVTVQIVMINVELWSTSV